LEEIERIIYNKILCFYGTIDKKGFVMKKWLFFILIPITTFAFELPDIKIPNSIKNIGKKTPIDINFYIKNPSTVCSLKVKNISNPYNQNIIRTKLPIVILKPGGYYRKDIDNILKGRYEFEYRWYKGGKFIDAGVKVLHIFAYHNKNLSLHKGVKLTFGSLIPKACK